MLLRKIELQGLPLQSCAIKTSLRNTGMAFTLCISQVSSASDTSTKSKVISFFAPLHWVDQLSFPLDSVKTLYCRVRSARPLPILRLGWHIKMLVLHQALPVCLVVRGLAKVFDGVHVTTKPVGFTKVFADMLR